MTIPFPEQRTQVRQLAALVLRRNPEDWPTAWEVILEVARQYAWNDIVTGLTARGYSGQQIERWDALPEMLRDLTLFWILTLAAAFTTVSESLLRRLDRRPELATLTLTIGGVAQSPAAQVIRCGPPSMGERLTVTPPPV